MQIVWGGSGCPEINAGIAAFVASHIPGCERGFANFKTMGVIKDGKLIAGVVYHNFAPEAEVIELSAAAVNRLWLTRPVMKAMFSYPFDELGCQMAVLRVSELNTTMVRIALAYGFKSHVIPRLRGRNEAEHILTLTDDDWRTSRFHKENA